MRKNGFVGILIIILVGLTIGLFYFVSQLNNSKKNLLSTEKSSKNKPVGISDFDLGQPEEPPVKFMFRDVTNNKLKFYNRDGKILSECGHLRPYLNAIMSPDSTKVIYPSDDYESNINLITGNCDSDEQITFLGRKETEKYNQIATHLLGWAPDSERFLFYLETRDTMGPPYRMNYPDEEEIKGIYLHNLKTGKSEKIISRDSRGDFDFTGWPNNYKNPIFSKYLYDHEHLYEFDLGIHDFKALTTNTSYNFNPGYYFPSESAVLWTNASTSKNYSQIMISAIDRSKELNLSPKGQFIEFQHPSLSPDKHKVGYLWWKGDGTYFTTYDITNQNIKNIKVGTTYVIWFDNSKILYSEIDGKIYIGDLESGKSELFADGVNPPL